MFKCDYEYWLVDELENGGQHLFTDVEIFYLKELGYNVPLSRCLSSSKIEKNRK